MLHIWSTCKTVQGGGVLLYFKNNINHSDNISIRSFDSATETIWCDILCAKDRLTVGVCYDRHGNSEIESDKLYGEFKSSCRW